MYGIWQYDESKRNKYRKHDGSLWKKGDTVYMSEIRVAPIGSDSLEGVIDAKKRFGTACYAPEELRQNEALLKNLAWRSKDFHSGMPMSSSDSVNFVFDVTSGFNDLDKDVLNIIAANTDKRSKVSPSTFPTYLEEGTVPYWTVPSPDDYVGNKGRMQGIPYLSEYPDMFWYYELFVQKFMMDMTVEDAEFNCNSFDYLDCMQSYVVDTYDPTLYHGAYSQGQLEALIADPHYRYGYSVTTKVDEDNMPKSPMIVYRNKPDVPLNSSGLKNNPLVNKSYNITGSFRMNPPLSESDVNGMYKEYHWSSGKITCDYCYINGDPKRHKEWVKGDGHHKLAKKRLSIIDTLAHPYYFRKSLTDEVLEFFGLDWGRWDNILFTGVTAGLGGLFEVIPITDTLGFFKYQASVIGDDLKGQNFNNYDDFRKSEYSCLSAKDLYKGKDTVCEIGNEAVDDSLWTKLHGEGDELLRVDILVDGEIEYAGFHKNIFGLGDYYQDETPWDPCKDKRGVNYCKPTSPREAAGKSYDFENIGTTANDFYDESYGEKWSRGAISQKVDMIVEELRGKFDWVLGSGKFKADSSNGSGLNAIERLRSHGFYFSAVKNEWYDMFIDSAWYIGNPFNRFLPYEDADDFIIRNGYYESDEEFLRLYMSDFRDNFSNLALAASLFTVVLTPMALDSYTEGKYTNQVFKLVFKWPVIYKDKSGGVYKLGDIIYLPNDKVIDMKEFPFELLSVQRKREHNFNPWGASILGHNIDLEKFEYGTSLVTDVRLNRFKDDEDSIIANIWVTRECTKCGQAPTIKGRFGLTDSKEAQNNYLRIYPVKGLEGDDTYKSYSIGGKYTLRDFGADRVDVHQRDPEVEKQLMWEIAQQILIGEGVNLTMKGVHWVATHPSKVPAWVSTAFAGMYKVGQRIENNKVVTVMAKAAKAGWRVHKEIQATLDLVYNVQQTSERIGKMFDGMRTAFSDIFKYYTEDFNWRWNLLSTNATKLLPFGAMRGADMMIQEFRGAIIDYNRALLDLTLHVDTLVLSPTIYYSTKTIQALAFSNNVEASFLIKSALSDITSIHKNTSKNRGKGVGQAQYVAVLVRGVLNGLEEVNVKLMSNGLVALSNVLDLVETESQDWATFGNYLAKYTEKDTYVNFWGAEAAYYENGGSRYYMPTMSPLINMLAPPSGLFAEDVNKRVLGAVDMWSSLDGWDFVSVDKQMQRKQTRRESNRVAEWNASEYDKRNPGDLLSEETMNNDGEKVVTYYSKRTGAIIGEVIK
jgi:hypothetical protein